MMREIKNQLCEMGKVMSREKIFEISPVFIFSYHDRGQKKYLENELYRLCIELEKSFFFTSKSNAFLNLTVGYHHKDLQVGLFDESNKFKCDLEQWILCYSSKYYVEQGIILIDVPKSNRIFSDNNTWKHLIRQMKRRKDGYLFFVSYDKENDDTTMNIFERNFFVVKHNVNNPTIENYMDWINGMFLDAKLSLGKTDKKEIERIILQNESSLNYNILSMWICSIVWKYYSDGGCRSIMQMEESVEDILSSIICKYENDAGLPRMGFST